MHTKIVGFLTPMFYEDPPLYCLLPPFFKIFPSSPLPHLHYSFSLSPCFFDCMGDSSIFDVLFCLMIWIYTCQALVTQSQKDLAVCPMQQGVKVTEVWHTLFFASNLIWYHTQTHTHTLDTKNIQVPVDWHTHINIY